MGVGSYPFVIIPTFRHKTVNESQMMSIRQFHSELVAAAKAGIPVDVGLGESPSTLAKVLEQTACRIEFIMRDGQTLETALAYDNRLSDTYRSALTTWLYCGHSPTALDSVTTPATTRARIQHVMQLSSAQPLVLVVLGYLAMLFVCLHTLPKFKALHLQIGSSTGIALSMLSLVREYLWLWAPIVPLLVILALVRLYRSTVCGGKRHTRAESNLIHRFEYAGYADRAACLVEHGIPLPKSLQLAGIRQLSTRYDARIEATETPYEHDAQAHTEFPALLRWAVNEKMTGEPTEKLLRFVASTYRRVGAMQTQRTRVWMPVIVSAVIGGFIVLIVALSVLAPTVEFLLQISRQGN
jgi:type II secretory pathway component PulF